VPPQITIPAELSFDAGLLMTAIGATLPAPAIQPNGSAWAGLVKTFGPAFTGPDLDRKAWTTTLPWGGNDARTLKNNGELEWYEDGQFEQAWGQLAIRIERKDGLPSITNDGGHANQLKYSSGILTSQDAFGQTYGTFELIAQLPQGAGLWPAFWMLPRKIGWPPELDVTEAFGGTNPNGEGGPALYHCAAVGENGGGWQDVSKLLKPGETIWNGLHSYAVKWQSDVCIYYFDRQEVCRIPTPADANQDMFPIVNVAVGGGQQKDGSPSWPGSVPDSDSYPRRMIVSAVNVYKP
jgi:beta-glucanase (GH16 family)